LDGADYSATYGITTTGNALKLNFITKASQTNVGSRTYLMAAGSTTKYQMLKLLGQEFTFDVDVSNLPCGLNGALYFSEMDEDGGMARFSTNKAGAKYGTGYCDAQCPQDIKFINGVVSKVFPLFDKWKETRLGTKPWLTTVEGQLCWMECLGK
jgi:cellulose 1,4-beta-cellobiosidase